MKRVALSVFVVVVLSLFACEKNVTEWREFGTGILSGTALLSETSDHRSIIIEAIPNNRDYAIRTHTDSSGFYSIPDLPVGTYSVRGKKYAYIPSEQSGVVVEDGETTEVDMFLTRASAQFVFDHFEAKLYYYIEEEDSIYWNDLRYKVRFHFENYDGAWTMCRIRVESQGFGGTGGSLRFLEMGQIDSLSRWTGHGSSSPEGILPPDSTVTVEVTFEGMVLVNEDFDTTGAVPLEASAYDTVRVIDGRPPDWPQIQVSEPSLHRIDE